MIAIKMIYLELPNHTLSDATIRVENMEILQILAFHFVLLSW